MFHLSDIFIGDYQVVEHFSANPAIYSARYNIQGYPGLRVSMPSLTPILSGADGFVLEVGFEEAGKGKFITIVHDGFLTTYGHLNDQLVQKDEKVIAGQLIGHSNQSGLTEIPCLYFGIAPSDGSGNKTEENGFGGYIDPMGEHVAWEVQNLKEPVTKAAAADKMSLSLKEHGILNAQAANYRAIVSFLKQTSFDEFLKSNGRVPINLDLTPDDSTGGESVAHYLSSIANEFEEMNATIETLEKQAQVAINKEIVPIEKKPSIMRRFLYAVKAFVLVDRSNI